MADLLNAYSRFVPDAVVRRHGRDPQPPSAAQANRFRGAVLMADIIGYTALTERYSRHPEGVEQLKTQLNDFFGRLNSVIFGYGGDIISFAGDSVFAVWRDGLAGDNVAVRGAAQCALEAQHTLDHSDLGESLMLRMRIVVASGDLAIATVGGHAGKWECVATGAPLAQIGGGVALAPPGGVVLDAVAQACLGQDADVTPLAEGYVSLSRLNVTVTPSASEPLQAPVAVTAALRAYIAQPVLKQLDAGQSNWLAEFRRVSTLFVRVSGIDYSADDALARLDAVTRAVQAAVARNEGTFHRVIVDDKGTNMLCVWGIPGCSHEDDAARALATALALPEELRALNCRCGLGISSGRALCGPAGGGRRFEYTVVGDTVNLAARLMVAAGEGILCDVATGDAAAGGFEFESLAPIEVKGRDGALPVLRPRARLRGAAAGTTRVRAHTNFFGRRAELDRLRNCMESMRAGNAALVTVEGEPGVGKSQLVAEFQRAIAAEGTTFLLGHADAIEHSTTYFIWREVLRQILNAADARIIDAQRRYLETMFARERELAGWLPLINDVLPLGFAESAALRGMSEQARAESTLKVLLHLLHGAIEARPVVLVLEDAHWMDSISWTLAARLLQREPSLMLVLVMRSGHAPESADGRELLAQTAAQRISLASFSREDTATLVCDRLRVSTVPDELITLIFERTDGHPLFSEELAYALRDSGYLLMRNGECLLAGEAARIDAPKMPETVEASLPAASTGWRPTNN